MERLTPDVCSQYLQCTEMIRDMYTIITPNAFRTCDSLALSGLKCVWMLLLDLDKCIYIYHNAKKATAWRASTQRCACCVLKLLRTCMCAGYQTNMRTKAFIATPQPAGCCCRKPSSLAAKPKCFRRAAVAGPLMTRPAAMLEATTFRTSPDGGLKMAEGMVSEIKTKQQEMWHLDTFGLWRIWRHSVDCLSMCLGILPLM